MTHTAGAYWTGVLPVAGVEFSMPLAYQTCEDAWTVMWYRGMQDLLQKAYNEKGVYYLGFQVPMGNRLIATKPIRTLNDFKGLKVRAAGTFATFAEKLGMSPVNIPITEIYMALKLGTIEAAITGMDVHTDSKHYEVAKYLINSPRFSFAEPLNVLINLELWNSLPKDLQSILQLVLRDWSHWGGMIIEPPRIIKTMNTFKAGNVELIDLSPEDTAKVQAAAVQVWDEWATKDKYCTDGVAILKNYLKEVGRFK
jgi:TRAP-type C4-dicarboxylate transport system substrate-binding protein